MNVGELKVRVAQVGSDTLVLLTISRNGPVFYSYFHLPLIHYLLYPGYQLSTKIDTNQK